MPRSVPGPARARRSAAFVAGAFLAAGSLVAAPSPTSAASAALSVPSAVATPRVFWPSGDGIRERTILAADIARPSTVTVTVVDYRGSTIRTLLGRSARAAGPIRIAWDGRTSAGTAAPTGGYRFRLTVTNDLGTTRPLDRPGPRTGSRPSPSPRSSRAARRACPWL